MPKCSYCSKELETVRGLKDHIRVHTGLKSYSLTSVVYVIPVLGHWEILMRHMTVDTGHKEYKCYVCNKTFSFQSTLSDHLKMHTADRCHLYGHCNKGFTTRGSLTSHVWHVHAEKKYKCTMCTMCFGVEKSLKRHITIHKNAEKFMLWVMLQKV